MSRSSEAATGRAHARGPGRTGTPSSGAASSAPSAVLRFALPATTPACISVLAADGRCVRTLRRAELPAGEHLSAWVGRDDRGQRVAPGVYTLQLEAAGRILTSRVVRLA